MNRLKILIFNWVLLYSFLLTNATEYYVSPSGNDNNPGTLSLPWKSIAFAVGSNSPVAAGDVIILQDGIYSYTNEGDIINFQKSGSPNHPITLKAQNKHMAVVQGRGNSSSIDWDGGQFKLFKKSHWVIDGIKIQNCPDWGIMIISCTDIFVKNCWTYRTDASGIIAMPETNTENYNYNIRYHNCKVEYAQYAMVKWRETNPTGCHSGAPFQEALDMWKVDGFEIIGCEVAYCTKEGIDAKSGSKNGIIKDNIVHHFNPDDIYCYTGPGIYLDGASDVDIFNNIIYAGYGSGISIGDEKDSTIRNINIYNNIVYDNCKKSGAQAGINWGDPSENVHIYNNTVVGTSQEYGIKASAKCISYCSVTNNLVVGNGLRQIDINSNGDIHVKNNVCGGENPVYLSQSYDGNGTLENNKSVSELTTFFENLEARDLRLKSGSPAIDWALATAAPPFDIDYTGRPQGVGDDAGAYEYGSDTSISVTNVEITNCPIVSLFVYDNYPLTAVVSPSNASNVSVTWSSSNNSVATVNNAGVVRAIADGTAIITVTTKVGGFKSNCNISVVSRPVKGVNITNCPTSSLIINRTYTLTSEVFPLDATNKTVSWSSSDTTVAIISTSGKITALSEGKTTITLKSNQGSLTDTCTIYVIPLTIPPLPTNGWREEFNLPDGTKVDNEDTKWSINYTGTGVFSVQKSEFKSSGTKTEAVWLSDIFSISDSASISVDIKGAGTLDDPDYIKVFYKLNGGKETLIAQRTNNFNDDNYETVSITGLSGTSVQVIIRAITSGDDEYHYWDNVTVIGLLSIVPVEKVRIVNCPNTSLNVNDTIALSAEISPPNANNPKITWTSSNASVSKVSSGGIVTAVTAGTATITATTEDGGFLSNCIVTVVSPGPGLNISNNQTSYFANIYPNPVISGNLYIDVPKTAELVSIYDVNGKKVYSNVNVSGAIEIEKTDLSTGLKIITVVSGNNVMIYKVMVE